MCSACAIGRRLSPLLALALALIPGAPIPSHAAPADRPVELPLLALITYCDPAPVYTEGFLTLESRDGQPHTLRVSPVGGTVVGLDGIRPWWIEEEEHDQRVTLAMTEEQRRLGQIDNERWLVLGLFAPALWPLAGGFATVVASPESAEVAPEATPLEWGQRYEQVMVPGEERLVWKGPAITVGGGPYDHAVLEVRPSHEPLAPQSALGLRLRWESALEEVPLIALQEIDPVTLAPIGEEYQLRPLLTRHYRDPECPPVSGPTDRAGWRIPSGQHIRNLIASAATGAPLAGSVAVSGSGLTVITTPSDLAFIGEVRGWEHGIPRWVDPRVFGLLSIFAYLIAGWLIAPTLQPMPLGVRLSVLGLGYGAGWALAVLLLPLGGLGYLGGVAITLHVWRMRGLGGWSLKGYLILALFLTLWSFALLPLLATAGLLPGT